MLVTILLAHGYLWWRLVRGTTRRGRARRRLTWVLVFLALLVTLSLLVPFPPVALVPLQWVGFSWLGVAFYASLALLVLEPVRAGAVLWLRRERDPSPVDEPTNDPGEPGGPAARGPEQTRRLFLARGLAAASVTGALATAGAGAWAANSAPVVRRLPVTLTGLSPALDGLRIVTFSDAHLSSTYSGRRFERVVEAVNAQRPDVIAIVGDLVDGELTDLREEVAPIADLVSEQGVYFVTGNHEYYVDTRAWLRHLPTLGVHVLRNERVAIGRGGATVDLAGIDDDSAAESGVPGHNADLDAALDGRDESTPVVLLAHQPLEIAASRAAGVDLQLSGHTHGGQLWPFDYAIRMSQPVVEGYRRYGDTQLYVSSGVGFWGPPMRIGARPEVVVVELRAPR
jgi:predicted MPP superfamily phosphohydrolase